MRAVAKVLPELRVGTHSLTVLCTLDFSFPASTDSVGLLIQLFRVGTFQYPDPEPPSLTEGDRSLRFQD